MRADAIFARLIRPDRDHALTFWVKATEESGEHCVDLEYDGGMGGCDCRDFRFRQAAARSRFNPLARCKHIALVQHYLAVQCVKNVMRTRGTTGARGGFS